MHWHNQPRLDISQKGLGCRMEISIRTVDRSRWQDLTELFGPSGAMRGCWCMARRLPAKEFQANGNAENRAALESLVHEGGRSA